jgi:hypothetical protein
MMEWISKLLNGESLKWLLFAVMMVNAMLSAVAVGLEAIGKAEKLPGWVKSVAAVVKKILDFLSANIQHK